MKTILILTAAVAMMAVSILFAPPADAQCVGGQCYGVPQTIYRPQITYQPWTYQGSVFMGWNRRAPLRNAWAGTPGMTRATPLRTIIVGPPWRVVHQYVPRQQAPQPQAGQ